MADSRGRLRLRRPPVPGGGRLRSRSHAKREPRGDYTATQSSAAAAALDYGLVADQLGVEWAFAAIVALALTNVPPPTPIRRHPVFA